jgi:hypothetical protein
MLIETLLRKTNEINIVNHIDTWCFYQWMHRETIQLLRDRPGSETLWIQRRLLIIIFFDHIQACFASSSSSSNLRSAHDNDYNADITEKIQQLIVTVLHYSSSDNSDEMQEKETEDMHDTNHLPKSCLHWCLRDILQALCESQDALWNQKKQQLLAAKYGLFIVNYCAKNLMIQRELIIDTLLWRSLSSAFEQLISSLSSY